VKDFPKPRQSVVAASLFTVAETGARKRFTVPYHLERVRTAEAVVGQWNRVPFISPGMHPNKEMRLFTATFVLAIAGIITLSGCGDQATAPVDPNILEIMQQIPELSIVTGLLHEAGLAQTVATETSITMFAPVNAAFEGVNPGEITEADLRAILRYHVATTALPSWELSDGQILETLQGETITVTISNNRGFVEDIQIIAVDGIGSNGVIHVIDGILVPPSLIEDEDDAE
jgi:hypothetical protein